MSDDDITMDDLMAKQKAMSEIAAGLADETDTDVIQQTAAELQAMGAELQAMAEKLAAKAGTVSTDKWTEVVLTPAQRWRIEAETGVKMESIKLNDPSGMTTQTMPYTDPRIIEYYAKREAERIKAGKEADEQLQAELQASIEAIESQGTPAVLEQLEQLKADPKFLGGILKKE